MKELWAALAKAQQEFPVIGKDKENSHFKSKYADLASVMNACKPHLFRNGLLVKHGLGCHETSDGAYPAGVMVIAQLIHWETGQIDLCEAIVPISKQDAQGYKSAVTYGKRITYETILGLAPDDDDDGEAAVGRGKSGTPAQQATARAPAPKPKESEAKAGGDAGVPFDHPTAAEVEALIDNARTLVPLNRAFKILKDAAEAEQISPKEYGRLIGKADEKKLQISKGVGQ